MPAEENLGQKKRDIGAENKKSLKFTRFGLSTREGAYAAEVQDRPRATTFSSPPFHRFCTNKNSNSSCSAPSAFLRKFYVTKSAFTSYTPLGSSVYRNPGTIYSLMLKENRGRCFMYITDSSQRHEIESSPHPTSQCLFMNNRQCQEISVKTCRESSGDTCQSTGTMIFA